MPNICKELIKQLNLQPGDILISEFPYEDAKQADYDLKKPLKDFKATHVSIYTGSYEKPFAHSLREGHKLPGVRLTKQWDGRHIVYRMSDPQIAAKAAEIARRWAISTQKYDLALFNKVYPAKFWKETERKFYLDEYFSLSDAVVSGPATPFNLERADKQISERTRKADLIEFKDEDLRRAVKFAARSKVFERISKGMRCTSFALAVYQAAMLQSIVKQTVCKFPFKELKHVEIAQTLNALMIENWHADKLGTLINDAISQKNYAQIFPGFDLNLKYALPIDLHKKISKSWINVGHFIIHDAKLLLAQCKIKSNEESPLSLNLLTLFEHKCNTADNLPKSAPSTPTRTQNNVEFTEQEEFRLDAEGRVKKYCTPPRASSVVLNTNKSRASRKLDMNI